MNREERKKFYGKFFLKKKPNVTKEQAEVARHKRKQKALYAKLTRDKNGVLRKELARKEARYARDKARAKKEEQEKETLLDAARDKSNALKYNMALARAKQGSVQLLLYNRARGMSEAHLIRIWGRELVSAAKTLRVPKKEESL